MIIPILVISFAVLLLTSVVVHLVRQRRRLRHQRREILLELQEAKTGKTWARGLEIVIDSVTHPIAQGLQLLEISESVNCAKFYAEPRDLVVGQPKDAALGLIAHLKLPETELLSRMAGGTMAIVNEFEAHGTDEDKECLEYVLRGAASEKVCPNGVRDAGRNGERLADFVQSEQARTAKLSEAHVLALRLYTTSCFNSLNTPLRDPSRTTAHPFAATVVFLTDGIKRLRSVDAHNEPLDLWRGLSNVNVTQSFENEGGSEYAPMSTTANPAIAMAYGRSEKTLLFKIVTKSFMDRGADLTFLSAFPEEAEYLYPPLTYLQPTSRREVVQVGASEVHVVEVEPRFSS